MLRAASWLLAGNMFAQGVRLLSSLILTRLLMPDAFGLMAVVNALYFGLMMFSDMGIWQSVVRSSHGEDPQYLGTAWTLQCLRGLVLAMLILLAAAGLNAAAAQGWFASASVYADPRLPSVVAAFALAALFQGGESMRLACAQRRLQTQWVVRLELITQALTVVLTVAAAFMMRSVWALLVGAVGSVAIRTVLSHLLVPGPVVRPAWSRESAREMVGFGKWVFVSSIFGFLAAHGEKLILGAVLGAASFGLFAIASNLLSAVVSAYGAVNGRVVFPGLSTALRANEHHAIRGRYLRVQSMADLGLGVVSGLLVSAGGLIVSTLYDPRYVDAGWMLQCLGLGLLGMRFQVLEQLMFAQGAARWVSANNLLRIVGLVLFIPLGLWLGGEQGAVLGVAASQFASWPVSLWFRCRHDLMSVRHELILLPATFSGVALGNVCLVAAGLFR